MKFSIIIPARNEERWLGACLDSIRAAARTYPGEVEVVVVLNRCTDGTELIAREHGAKVISDEARNLAHLRNAGARASSGDILVTIDADSTMTPNMLTEIDRKLRSGKYIGGGVPIHPERLSLGLVVSGLLILSFLPPGISAGLFWCLRSVFEVIGGFDESRIVGEDVDFAIRLKAYGKKRKQRFGTLWKTHITTSCRKFDQLGDWFLAKKPWVLWRAIHGTDTSYADLYFYDFMR